MRQTAEVTKQGIDIKTIMKDYSKVRDWELKVLIERGYEEAIVEQRRRVEGQ